MTPSDSTGLARFLTLADVAAELAISVHQASALVRSGELPAIKVGGHWRVETVALEGFIADKYEESRRHARWQQAQYADVADLFGER
jgi:excisionase family DNA binding protein